MVALQEGEIVLDGRPGDLMKRDVAQFGLESPLSIRVARELALKELPLSVGALETLAPASVYPSKLKPELRQPVPADSPTVLEAEDVSFRLGRSELLRDVRFALRRGECLAVVGANGAGKTTLLRHLNGLLRPNHGQVLVMGQDTRKAKVSELARHVGIAFQNPDNQFFKLTVRDEISVGPKVMGVYHESWLKELVELFGLESLLDRAPYRLSGGEKKRLAFAAALACKPAILALDEPTAGQDFHFRTALGKVLSHLQDQGQAVLLATHDLSFAEQHAHRWLLLSQGQIIADGPPWAVMEDAENMVRANLEPTDAFLLYGRDHEKDETRLEGTGV
jgi:energy-coupling factor transport system ATP-binding protein